MVHVFLMRMETQQSLALNTRGRKKTTYGNVFLAGKQYLNQYDLRILLR